MTREQEIQNGYKKFEGDGYTIIAHPKSCFFCKHCVEILFDFTNGPYMFVCDKEKDTNSGLKGECSVEEK